MKKIFFLLFLAILMAFAGHLPAAPVDSAQSKRVAANFYKEKVGRAMGRAALEPRTAYTYRTSSSSSMTAAAECFRIYNVGNGFVIVSSDDRIEPVLGYSTEGNFDIHNIPEPLQGLLDYYAATIERVLSGPSGTDARMVSKWRDMASARGSRSRAITAVAPLLTSRWGRFTPTMRNVPPRLSVTEDMPTRAAWPSPCRKSSATGNILPMVLEATATTVLSWHKVSKFTASCLPILHMQATITPSCRTRFPPAVPQPRSKQCPI